MLAISTFVKKYKLEVFDIERLSTHGGSLRYYIKRYKNKKFKVNKNVRDQLKTEIKFGLNKYKTYLKFANNVKNSKKKLREIFNKIKQNNKTIIGYGSTAKACTILAYCKIESGTLDYFLDTTPSKVGKYMPGSHIYIKKYTKPLTDEVDYVFLGAWNFKKEIFKKEKKYIKGGGKFITHIPFPQIINK